MNPKKLLFSLPFAFGLALAGGLSAQTPAPAQRDLPIRFPDLPQASPACTTIQRVGFTQIEIEYSRPSMGRHSIFGGIVPYNDLWRTGDNASTKITFSTPVKLGGPDGAQLPAGKYSLFTIPDEKAWTVIFNKDTGGWGKENYDDRKDVARFKVAPLALKDAVETFTIDINDIQDDSATLNLMWARVRVPVKLQVDNIVSDLLLVIQASMSSPGVKSPATYLKAATFYFDHTNDLAQPLLWVNAGVATHPPIEYQLLYLKAKILAKMGDRDGAAAAATQSSRLAMQAEGPGTAYFKLNQEVIAGLR